MSPYVPNYVFKCFHSMLVFYWCITLNTHFFFFYGNRNIEISDCRVPGTVGVTSCRKLGCVYYLPCSSSVTSNTIRDTLGRRKFNLLKPTGYVMHQQVQQSTFVRSVTLYLRVLYLSENKQRLVPLTP